jgi:hypothetical protein
MALDSEGLPVMSFAELVGTQLLKCNDPNCFGGDETITVLHADAFSPTRITLDELDNPVVVYKLKWLGSRTPATDSL